MLHLCTTMLWRMRQSSVQEMYSGGWTRGRSVVLGLLRAESQFLNMFSFLLAYLALTFGCRFGVLHLGSHARRTSELNTMLHREAVCSQLRNGRGLFLVHTTFFGFCVCMVRYGRRYEYIRTCPCQSQDLASQKAISCTTYILLAKENA